MVAKELTFAKTQELSKEEVDALINIDATEQPIERPQKVQKKYYSGKKKRHTLTTEVRVTRKGRTVHVSEPEPGSMHDFGLHKNNRLFSLRGECLLIQTIKDLIKHIKLQNYFIKIKKLNP